MNVALLEHMRGVIGYECFRPANSLDSEGVTHPQGPHEVSLNGYQTIRADAAAFKLYQELVELGLLDEAKIPDAVNKIAEKNKDEN